jgi:Contractile injection system tube protein
MERAAFLIEETNQRIGCLLNPESLVMRRTAGLRARQSIHGQLTGAGQAENTLLYTGGGHTELELDLLFDVQLAGSSITSDDVRDLTRPLWDLSENNPAPTGSTGYRQPPVVRFVWGKSWNVPAVVAAIAERLEEFTPGGAPQRSWLRVRLVRINEPARQTAGEIEQGTGLPNDLLDDWSKTQSDSPADGSGVMHEILGGNDASGADAGANGGAAERLDEIAFRYFKNASIWRLLAKINNIDDPLHLETGTLLRIPETPGQGVTYDAEA